MATGRTRRIQFSKIRFSSPTRRGPYSVDPPTDDSKNAASGGDPNNEGCWELFKAFWSCSNPGYFWINWIAILGHLTNSIVMMAIYANRDSLGITYTENVLEWKRSNGTCSKTARELETANNGKFCIGPVQNTFDCDGDPCALDYGWMIISFHLLSFAFQLLAALTDCCKKGCLGYRYSDMIREGRNPLRFIEYSISASIMLMIIALINGIIDIHLLFCIAVLTASCQLCGLVVEYIDDINMKWINHLNGWLTFCSAYWCITRAFVASAEAVDGVSPPDFVYLIVLLLFLLYASFGMVQLVELMCITKWMNFKINWFWVCPRWCGEGCCKCFERETDSVWCPSLRKDDRCNPLYKEMVFVTLSLGAKMVLGWMLFVNILMA